VDQAVADLVRIHSFHLPLPCPETFHMLEAVRRGSSDPQGVITVSDGIFSGGPFMGKKLYVGNLAYAVTDSDLQQMFEAHGTVQSAQVIIDRDTGRSKGFGFVEMGSDAEAQAAITALNGADKDGRPLTVKGRPSFSTPFSAAMAAWASASLPISTKPKPLERPVSRSMMTCADCTEPCASNICCRSLSVTA